MDILCQRSHGCTQKGQKVSCQLQTLSKVTRSRLVGVHDLTFLCSLESHLKETQQSTGHLIPVIYVFTSGVLFLAASACLLLPQAFKFSAHGLPVSQRDWLDVCLGSLFFPVAVGIFIKGICHHQLVRKFYYQTNLADDYVHQEELFQKGFRRSLQYIQEVEVLSRGYTMVNVTSYSGSDLSNLQLLPLRKSCLSAITKHLITLRDATKQLATEFIVLPEFMLSDECITNQKLPDWIEKIALDKQHEATTTNGTPDKAVYSLSTLKILFGLYKEQCSDFIRQLVLSWLDSVQVQKSPQTDLNKLKEWLHILKQCLSECRETTGRLNQTYKLHKWSPASDKVTPTGSFSRREVWRPEVQLVTALHSLRLHSEAVLERICPFDDTMADSEEITMTEDSLDELKNLLSEISEHIEASQMCYQETKASLEKLLNRGNTQNAADEEGGPIPEENANEEPIKVHVINDDSDEMDSDFEEQIFEAYIDVKKKLQEDEDSEEWLQEKIQRRREAEDAKRMLQELNCVLSKRSEEKEKHKQEKRQRKMKGLKQETKDTSLTQDHINSLCDTGAQTLELTKQSHRLLQNVTDDNVETSSECNEDYKTTSDYSNSKSIEYSRELQSGDDHLSEEQSNQSPDEFKRDNFKENSENVYHTKNYLDNRNEETFCRSEDNPNLFEYEHCDDLNSDDKEEHTQSQDRIPFLAVNPWMVPGLASQIAKISQQKIQLSEDTFGEDCSDEEDETQTTVEE
ncbi:Vezatin [Holothuria leucospilota]|uniref:Vezatin n=1 Tax=Holothuria leucospilota TaxID=206669 RepID=A0A9Q1CM19_HOLLE|nr:Vezatin [Holothuria leucospilota]